LNHQRAPRKENTKKKKQKKKKKRKKKKKKKKNHTQKKKKKNTKQAGLKGGEGRLEEKIFGSEDLSDNHKR